MSRRSNRRRIDQQHDNSLTRIPEPERTVTYGMVSEYLKLNREANRDFNQPNFIQPNFIQPNFIQPNFNQIPINPQNVFPIQQFQHPRGLHPQLSTSRQKKTIPTFRNLAERNYHIGLSVDVMDKDLETLKEVFPCDIELEYKLLYLFISNREKGDKFGRENILSIYLKIFHESLKCCKCFSGKMTRRRSLYFICTGKIFVGIDKDGKHQTVDCTSRTKMTYDSCFLNCIISPEELFLIQILVHKGVKIGENTVDFTFEDKNFSVELNEKKWVAAIEFMKFGYSYIIKYYEKKEEMAPFAQHIYMKQHSGYFYFGIFADEQSYLLLLKDDSDADGFTKFIDTYICKSSSLYYSPENIDVDAEDSLYRILISKEYVCAIDINSENYVNEIVNSKKSSFDHICKNANIIQPNGDVNRFSASDWNKLEYIKILSECYGIAIPVLTSRILLRRKENNFQKLTYAFPKCPRNKLIIVNDSFTLTV